jgi:uncharacterized membrane protein
MAVMTALGVVIITRIEKPAIVSIDHPVGFARAQEIIVQRCIACHSRYPTDTMFPVAPVNVIFDTAEQIAAMAPRIKERAVLTQGMPFLNRTSMTETERAELRVWIDNGAKLE